MIESNELEYMKLNCAVVFYGKLRDLNDIIAELESRDCKIVFIKKSLNKIFISEVKNG